MNLGIDGLFNIIRSEMKGLSPISGVVFLFFGKNRQGVKILHWDGDGFLLYYKRLEGGSFELPTFNPDTGNYEVSYQILSFYPEWRSSCDCENALGYDIIVCSLIIYITNIV